MNINEQFELLRADGKIGFYTHCEILQIFGYSKEIEKAFNIYTLVVFQDKSYTECNPKFLTNKLLRITENISCGIQSTILSIEKAILFFNDLSENKNFQLGNNPNCNIGDITFLDKIFVISSNSYQSSQLNYILKNNFHNGSYIIEAFDKDKKHVSFLLSDPVKLNAISEKISEIIPLKISNVSDRLGNIIFQFPITNFTAEVSCSPNDKSLIFSLDLYKKYILPNSLLAIVSNKFDNTIVDFNTKILTSIQDSIEINSFGIVEVSIIDKSTNLILYHDEASFFSSISVFSNMISHQNRCFSINDESFQVPIFMQNHFNVGKNEVKNERELVNQRKYLQQQKDLDNSKEFVQYLGNSSQKALIDLRSLVAKYGDSGVYLWDPYLSAIDIKNTLYFTPKIGTTLKAITSLKHNKSQNEDSAAYYCISCHCKTPLQSSSNSKINIIQEMKNEFEKDVKKFLFLNLEVRGRFGNNGYDFHDRFIIFPSEQPLVWSLGVSVNQLGQSHHILQKVSNPQHVLDAFNKLWNELSNPECLIWKN